MLFPILLMLQAATQAPPPHAVAPRLELADTVDGFLTEPAWQQAARLTDFHQYTPVDGRPAEERTEVLVWYAPDAIYFGILAYDNDPSSIRATRADRDRLDAEDRVTLYLDTFNDRRRAYFFTVNPIGIQEDGVRTEGGFTAGSLVGGTTDKNPDFTWESRGRLTDSGYVVEIRIPFKSIRYGGGSEMEWGLNVDRRVQRTGYEDTWADTRRANASFLLQSGSLGGLHDLHRGIVTEVQPFVTVHRDGSRNDTTGVYTTASAVAQFGINVRLGLTSTTTVDATYNPDFSQIESDVGQVTVNERFALFYPEKRPFFLEGIDAFSVPNRLVYTRQIQDPIWGGKVTSKTGPLSIGFLSSEDELAGPDAFFNILRVRGDIGTNSTAGIVATDRRIGDSANTVLAADTRLVFAKLYYFAAQAGVSSTQSDAPTVTAPLGELEFDRTGRSWGFNYKVTAIGDGFNTEAGFIPRTDIVQARAFNRVSWYGSRGALVERVNVFAGLDGLWQYSAFAFTDPLEGDITVNSDFQLKGGWKMGPQIVRNFVHYVPGTYDDYTVDTGGGTQVPYAAPEGVDNAYSVTFNISTPVYQVVDASANIAFGRQPIFDEASTGNVTTISLASNFRPLTPLRIQGLLAYQTITRDRDGSEFARTIIPRLKIEYQVTRPLFFRLVGEYRAERRDQLLSADQGLPLLIGGVAQPAVNTNTLRLDALISYQPTPGTVAFFGYGAGMNDGDAFAFQNLQRETDGFFVKFAYQFRW